jgi:hypothetical protein
MPGKRSGSGFKSFGTKQPVHAVMTRALWPRTPSFGVAVRDHMIKTHEKHLRTQPPRAGTRRPKW